MSTASRSFSPRLDASVRPHGMPAVTKVRSLAVSQSTGLTGVAQGRPPGVPARRRRRLRRRTRRGRAGSRPGPPASAPPRTRRSRAGRRRASAGGRSRAGRPARTCRRTGGAGRGSPEPSAPGVRLRARAAVRPGHRIGVPQPDHGRAARPHAVVARVLERAPHGDAQLHRRTAPVPGDVGEVLAPVEAQAATDDPVGMKGPARQPLHARSGLDDVDVIGEPPAQRGQAISQGVLNRQRTGVVCGSSFNAEALHPCEASTGSRSGKYTEFYGSGWTGGKVRGTSLRASGVLRRIGTFREGRMQGLAKPPECRVRPSPGRPRALWPSCSTRLTPHAADRRRPCHVHDGHRGQHPPANPPPRPRCARQSTLLDRPACPTPRNTATPCDDAPFPDCRAPFAAYHRRHGRATRTRSTAAPPPRPPSARPPSSRCISDRPSAE